MAKASSSGMTVGTSSVAETKGEREVSEKSQIDEAYSLLDALVAPERVVQLAILGVTLHIAFTELYDLNSEYRLVFRNGAIVAISILMGAYSRYRSSGWNPLVLPKFETVYLIYLPFMTLLLFDRSHATINCSLILNCVEMPLMFKLPMQGIFVLLSESKAELNDKLAQLGAIIINYLAYTLLAKASHLKSLDTVDCNLFSILLTNVLYIHDSESIYFQVLKETLSAFLIIVGVNYVADILLGSIMNAYLKSAVIFSSFAVGFPTLVRHLLKIDGQDPLEWLIDYIMTSDTRQNLLIIWLTSLLVLIPNVLILKSNITLNSSRKVWHFLILLLITKPFQMDPNFVKISLAGSIVLFLSVEYLRYLKLEPVGGYIDSKLRLFADFRDEKGPIIISYIYLIVGIATPLLINDSPVGLISLGVGDSLASIIGGKWGKKFWAGTNKTMEGTIAFIGSTTVTAIIFKQYLGYFQNISYSNLSVVCTLTGLLEGNSIINDNIMIPAFMLIAEQLFTNRLITT